MRQHRSIVLGITLITLGLTTNAPASGTHAPGGSGGNDYHMAKLIFYKKIVCGRCPFPGRGKSAQDAQALLQELNADNALASKEQQAATSYLQRRFKLTVRGDE